MSGTVISARDLQRMKASVNEPELTSKQAKRLYLHSMSKERANQWPNTLEAMRRKKDNWKKDKEQREENRRLEIDAQEYELQKARRLRQIEEANRLMYDQTDKMKTLRSKQMLCDVLQDRKIQIKEKNYIKNREAQKDIYWHEMMKKQIEEGEQKDKEAIIFKQQKDKFFAKAQRNQLDEYKEKFIEQLKEEKNEGELIKAQAERLIQEEEENERERRRLARMANEETRLANERLHALRAKEAEKEILQEEKRKADQRKKEEIIAKRNELQGAKEKKKQKRIQTMIDLATQHLLSMEQNTEHRLENQKKEVEEKTNQELQRRADRRQKEKEATDKSRKQQLRDRAERKARQLEEASVLIKQWTEHGAKVEKILEHEEEDRRKEDTRVAGILKAQADAKKSRLMEDRAATLLSEKASLLALQDENIKYQQVAREAMEEAKQSYGSDVNLYPMQKALAAKSIDLLPASGFRT